MGKDKEWEACIFCMRLWKPENLELELCPDCLKALRSNPYEYDLVKLEQLLKYGQFNDRLLADAVMMLLQMVKNRE